MGFLIVSGASCTQKPDLPAINTSGLINSLNQLNSIENLNQPAPINQNVNTNTNINTNSVTSTSPLPIEETVAETVIIKNSIFDPTILSITVGTTVTWKNEDSLLHQIAADPNPEHADLPDLLSKVLATGESYSYTFTTKGTYGYHCNLHPAMKGTIMVE